MRIKHAVWICGFFAMCIALYLLGIDRLSSWIQFFQGTASFWAIGEYIEQRPEVKRYRNRMDELHQKHDERHQEVMQHVRRNPRD